MMSESLLRAIGDISDELVILPAKMNTGKANLWVKWGVAVACVCLMVGAVMLPLLLNVIQPKSAIETPVVDSTEINEVPSDKSEERNMCIIRNFADVYKPIDYGEPAEVLSFDTAAESFSVYGGQLLPEVLNHTVTDKGAVLLDRPTDVIRYCDIDNELDIFKAEYQYESEELGTFTITAENTLCPNIGSDEYEPSFYSNNERLDSDSDSISFIEPNTVFAAETSEYVYAQIIVPSPRYLNRIDESEQEVKDGVFVSYDELPEEYILLTFCFEKHITDEQLVRVLDTCWVFISNSYLQ